MPSVFDDLLNPELSEIKFQELYGCVFTYRATHIMLATGEKKLLSRHNRSQRVAAAKQLLVPSATSDSASLNVKVFNLGSLYIGVMYNSFLKTLYKVC